MCESDRERSPRSCAAGEGTLRELRSWRQPLTPNPLPASAGRGRRTLRRLRLNAVAQLRVIVSERRYTPFRIMRQAKELIMSLSITLIGGPTALVEIDGFRLLTDPTFDAPGSYQLQHVKLEKLEGPAISADAIGEIDAVLLSHDQHADNLDHSGKDFLAKARRVLTTE